MTLVSDHVPKYTCSQSAVRGVSCNDTALNLSDILADRILADLTIDRRNWKIKKRKIKLSEEQNIKKKGYDQARGRTRVNIGVNFQQWRELKEQEGPELNAEVA